MLIGLTKNVKRQNVQYTKQFEKRVMLTKLKWLIENNTEYFNSDVVK